MKDFDKEVDLHESEWRKEGKSEPFFGPGAYWFSRVTIPTMVVTLAFAYGFNFILSLLFHSPFDR